MWNGWSARRRTISHDRKTTGDRCNNFSSLPGTVPIGSSVDSNIYMAQANVDVDGITAEVEISDSEEYNRALLLPRSHVIMLVVPVSFTNFK